MSSPSTLLDRMLYFHLYRTGCKNLVTAKPSSHHPWEAPDLPVETRTLDLLRIMAYVIFTEKCNEMIQQNHNVVITSHS